MIHHFLVDYALSVSFPYSLVASAAQYLHSLLTSPIFAVFETRVRYHMFHALALFAVAWECTRGPGQGAIVAGGLFVAGTVIFSGSLYLLAISGWRWLGMITPLGGLCFLAGWVVLGWRAFSAG